MAILTTDKISIYVLENKVDSLMDWLQEKGRVEIAGTPQKNVGSALAEAEKAIGIINRYSPKRNSFFKKPSVRISYDEERTQLKKAQEQVENIITLDEKLRKEKDETEAMKKTLSELFPYRTLDCPSAIETEHCIAMAGECSKAEYEKYKNTAVLSYIIAEEKSKLYIWLIYLKTQDDAAEEFFKKIRFKKCEFNNGISPKEESKRLNKQILQSEIPEIEKKLKALSEKREEIEIYYDQILLKTEKYREKSKLASTEQVKIITGYALKEDIEGLAEELERKFSAVLEMEETTEILPTAFRNNALVSPVEEITASYSMPDKTDIDPNPIMAVFYYWFFGMMFSDAGYGLLMMLVCGALGFSGLLDKLKRHSYRLFFWCGVSTTLWGIAYGSFFGDLIGVISQTFGDGKLAFAPILLDPVNQALQLLILSAGFGIIHIVTALSIRFYILWRKKDRVAAVCDVGFWLIALLGVVILAGGAFLKSNIVLRTGIILSVLSALGLVLTGGRDKKNLFMKLIGGVMKLYDITGYVGDILSYSRLMALGLATGVIAAVVNVLASLGGNSPLGLVIFVLVAIVGHTLNLAINMLGAYVHTNRLQYVEFYQKFYSGGGRKFEPFKINTKYFDLDRRSL